MNRILTIEEMRAKQHGYCWMECVPEPDDPPTVPADEYLQEMTWNGDQIMLRDIYGTESTSTWQMLGPEEYGITWRCWAEKPAKNGMFVSLIGGSHA